MEANIKKRKQELERTSNVTAIEAASLTLEILESKEFKIKDLQACQRIRTRFTRLGEETGRCYSISMNGNNLIVTRNNDIVQD